MKSLAVVLLTLILSTTVQAGDVTQMFTCKNADGSIIVTEKRMFLLQEDAIKSLHVHTFKANSKDMPAKGVVLNFSSEMEEMRKTDYLLIKEIVGRKTIFRHIDKGGFGSDYRTESYIAKAELALAGENSEVVTLNCIQSTETSNK